MYENITKYEFANYYIRDNFKNRKEYYYLGFQSIDGIISKVIYRYLTNINDEISFCCDFVLLQKIVKRITSKEYFNSIFTNDEKYIYSFIGAVICDDYSKIDDVISEIYKIEDYLLTIFKKENNKYLEVKKYLSKNNFELTTMYNFTDYVECTCNIVELNHYFTNQSKTMLEAKYIVIEEIYEYLVDKRLLYKINEVLGEFDVDNACLKLEELYKLGYVSEPNYLYLEHDQFKNIKYEVRCSVEGLSFYSIKIHDNKNTAKNQAAFSMLEMIIIQNNT